MKSKSNFFKKIIVDPKIKFLLFGSLNLIIAQKDKLNSIINEKINAQIDRTRNEESSPKNTTLYFNILLETKDLLKSVFNLIDEYSNSYKKE